MLLSLVIIHIFQTFQPLVVLGQRTGRGEYLYLEHRGFVLCLRNGCFFRRLGCRFVVLDGRLFLCLGCGIGRSGRFLFRLWQVFRQNGLWRFCSTGFPVRAVRKRGKRGRCRWQEYWCRRLCFRYRSSSGVEIKPSSTRILAWHWLSIPENRPGARPGLPGGRCCGKCFCTSDARCMLCDIFICTAPR